MTFLLTLALFAAPALVPQSAPPPAPEETPTAEATDDGPCIFYKGEPIICF